MDAINQEHGEGWTLYNGDSCEVIKEIPDNKVGLSIFSPPFASLYTYSNSERDMGNCKDSGQFFEHFGFLIAELHRITMPGRIAAAHCMNLPTSKTRHGYIGLEDFRGDIIRAFQEGGWIYHSEVTIWKDPVTAMQRTKALGLLHKQLKKDACMSRQGVPDYLCMFRKPGDNPEPVSNTNESFPVAEWQRFASPVWASFEPEGAFMNRWYVDEKTGANECERVRGKAEFSEDIRSTRTLQSMAEEKDERHICPLQLDVIERAVKLWSNEGDTVFSPFAGIGSEGYQSVKMGRKFVGIELKEAYFGQAVKNICKAESEVAEKGLFA